MLEMKKRRLAMDLLTLVILDNFRKQIYLHHYHNHFDVITSVSSFLGKKLLVSRM